MKWTNFFEYHNAVNLVLQFEPLKDCDTETLVVEGVAHYLDSYVGRGKSIETAIEIFNQRFADYDLYIVG